MISVLLVNHSISNYCGIYSHGVRMFNILKCSKKYKFHYTEANSFNDLLNAINNTAPYNYTPNLMPWATNIKNKLDKILHVALQHDTLQEHMDQQQGLDNFDFRIALDPTLNGSGKWFTTVRPLFGYKLGDNIRYPISIPKIGSFGFFFPHKNFHTVVGKALAEFKRCEINLHITLAHFGLATKDNLDNWIIKVKSKIPEGVVLNVTTDYMSDKAQIDFLNNNDVNYFPYDYNYGSGPSSAIDYAVAAGKPILISKSFQFRHIWNKIPSDNECTLVQAIQRGNASVLELQNEWSEDNFLKNYEGIIYEVQNRKK
jgi:hypothetical protein